MKYVVAAAIIVVLLVSISGCVKQGGTSSVYDPNMSCEKMENATFRDVCYGLLAENTNDSSKCDMIEDRRSKLICDMKLGVPGAQLALDTASCEMRNAPEKKGECWEWMATYYNDSSYCENIDPSLNFSSDAWTSGNILDRCYRSMNLCESIMRNDTVNRDWCYYDRAIGTFGKPDPSWCNYIYGISILGGTIKEHCLTAVSIQLNKTPISAS